MNEKRDLWHAAHDTPQGVASGDSIELTTEQVRARKRRSLVIGLSLVAFVVLVFFVSMARMTANMHAPHPVAEAAP